MALDFTVNGTSLNSGTICRVARWEGILSNPPLRGANDRIPGVAGATWRPKVRDAYVFSVPIVLLGSSRADLQDRRDDLLALLDSSSAALTLERTRPTGLGDVVESCDGDFLDGLELEMVNLSTGRAVLNFENLSGSWT